MAKILHFEIKTADGLTHIQDIKIAEEHESHTEDILNQALAQFAQLGMLKRTETGRFTFIPANQIKLVEGEIKSSLLVEATPNDVGKVAAAASGLKLIKT